VLPAEIENNGLPSPPSSSPSLTSPSIGSMLHGSGQCKPCLFFHRAEGCWKGRECSHCHACPPDATKGRIKAKSAAGKV
jgi:hypothetical protein